MAQINTITGLNEGNIGQTLADLARNGSFTALIICEPTDAQTASPFALDITLVSNEEEEAEA